MAELPRLEAVDLRQVGSETGCPSAYERVSASEMRTYSLENQSLREPIVFGKYERATKGRKASFGWGGTSKE
jgi:hypothetical protein